MGNFVSWVCLLCPKIPLAFLNQLTCLFFLVMVNTRTSKDYNRRACLTAVME